MKYAIFAFIITQRLVQSVNNIYLCIRHVYMDVEYLGNKELLKQHKTAFLASSTITSKSSLYSLMEENMSKIKTME